MSDPRRHRAEAPAWPTRDASTLRRSQGTAWVMALERAAHPELNGLVAPHPRRRILDAFVATVAREGYLNTRLASVLELAEVPEPVFQEHFEDQQDCMIAALDEIVYGLRHILRQRIATRTLWSEQVEGGLETLLTALACHPDGAKLAFVEYLSAGERAVALVRSATARVVPLMEQGRNQGEDTAHLPPQASEAIVGGVAAILHRHVLEGRTAELPGLLPDLLYFTLLPYLGHERTQRACTAAERRLNSR